MSQRHRNVLRDEYKEKAQQKVDDEEKVMNELLQTVCMKTQDLVIEEVKKNPKITEDIKTTVTDLEEAGGKSRRTKGGEKLLRKYLQIQNKYRDPQLGTKDLDVNAYESRKQQIFKDLIAAFKAYNYYKGLRKSEIARPIRSSEEAPSPAAAPGR